MNRISKSLLRVVVFPFEVVLRFCFSLGWFPQFKKAADAAKEFGRGSSAYEKGDYEIAFRILKPLADVEPSSGYERSVICCAQYNIGLMYFHGYGVQQNQSSGREYFKRAASLGNPHAIEYLKDVNQQAKSQ